MQTFLQDLRYGIRMLAKSPGFTAVAVLTLALGIGANTAIFSVVKAVLLNALPYRQPERLVTLAEADKDTLNPTNTSYGTFVEWRARSRSFEKMALFRGWSATLAGVGEPEQLRGMRVSSGFFDVLGVKPLEGREFLPEEDRPDRRYVVMLSHGFWQRRFGGDPGVVGKRITLDEVPFTIVGVLPAEFRPLLFSAWSQPPDLWAVLGYDASLPYACRTCQHLQAVARLKAGVTIGQATAEMKAVDQSLVREYPTDYPADAYVIITPVRDRVVGNVDKALWILLGAVGFLLLIACANVANLLLARATARRKEVALRAALGAGRMRIARQLLTESLLVALLGGAGGVLAAMWSTSALTTLGPKQIPRLDEITVDASVLLFALGASVLTGVLFGLAPAFQASRVDLNKALKDAGRGSDGASRHDLRGLLVVGEMALAFVLVVGAGLLVKSFARLLQVDPGFDPKRVLTLNISLAGSKYRENPAAVARFYEQSLEGVRALAGVEAAGVTTALPISGGYDRAGFIVQDRLLPDPEVPSVDRYIVSPGYFRALRIPLKRGRLFTEQDRADSLPVALVGEALARQQWPGEDALGKRIQLGGRDEKKPWYTVVGIVGDVRQYSLDNPPTMQAYQPEAQLANDSVTLVVRSNQEPGALERAVRQAVWTVDKNQAVYGAVPMEEQLSTSLAERRFTMLLLGLFGGLALVLATVGIYGVISYSVSLRTREVGIRMALGAAGRDVLALVLGKGLALTAAGLGLGFAASLVLTRLLGGLLYEVRPADPVTSLVVAAVLAGAALLASYVPARRATKVDPMAALRYE